MDEYINRTKLKQYILNDIEECGEPDSSHRPIAYGVMLGLKQALSFVNVLPAADVVEVKHGNWKDTEYGTCSVCDRSISEIYDADSSMASGILDELTACPFCGAKIDGCIF